MTSVFLESCCLVCLTTVSTCCVYFNVTTKLNIDTKHELRCHQSFLQLTTTEYSQERQLKVKEEEKCSVVL